MRVASVLPSATEIVCALGARDELVGRSAECDYPESVASLPVLMRPRTPDQDRPSAEIDRRVRESLARGESLYSLDLDALRRLKPDVLLTQDLCRVCSVTGPEVEAACAKAGVRPRIVSLSPTTLDEVWDSVDLIGASIGRAERADELSRELRARTRPTRRSGPRKVAVVEWLDPPILAGLWTPEMVRRAGGVPLGPSPGATARTTTWSEIGAGAPDLVILSPCSFSVPRTLAELARPALRGEISRSLAGIRTLVADEAYFSRPGPRLAAGVELVRELLLTPRTPPDTPMPVAEWETASTEVGA